jgi:hypothetical protein
VTEPADNAFAAWVGAWIGMIGMIGLLRDVVRQEVLRSQLWAGPRDLTVAWPRCCTWSAAE